MFNASIELDKNQVTALVSALENYLNGNGMEDGDEDESVIDGLIFLFDGATVKVSD